MSNREVLPSDRTCILEAESGKLDIKRCEPSILFISLSHGSLLKSVIMTYSYPWVVYVLIYKSEICHKAQSHIYC